MAEPLPCARGEIAATSGAGWVEARAQALGNAPHRREGMHEKLNRVARPRGASLANLLSFAGMGGRSPLSDNELKL
ncbi:MAG: hypothetical protein AB7M12_10210 [Hyphomonadaceae bacterium]